MKSTNIDLYGIRSKYIIKKIFDNLKFKQLLKIIKYNKKLQNKIGINSNNYKNYSKIIIEVIPLENHYKNFINIIKDYKPFYHFYFNDSKNEITRDFIEEGEKIKKIKIILDNEIKSLSGLFRDCEIIEKINFVQFFRDDITDMSYMFYRCSSLTELNLKNFNTDNVTNMSWMFSCCKKLTSLDLSKFNTKNVTNMMQMFSKCESLNLIDISKFYINHTVNKTYMFVASSNLTNIIITKNFLEDVESSFNNNNIKKNYYLINSIKFKFNPSKRAFSPSYNNKFIKQCLDRCLFDAGFQIFSLIDDTLLGALEGPIYTSYEKGIFFFKIKYEKDYPFNPPKFYFISKIFHPNISEDGLVSNKFYMNWTSAMKERTLILSIQSLLGTPYSEDFLNQEAGKLYKENINLYEDTVKDYVKKYANYSIYKNKLKEYEVEDLFKINEN